MASKETRDVVFSALSHPLRIKILERAASGPVNPKELAQMLDEPLGNVSYHVRMLADAGLIGTVAGVAMVRRHRRRAAADRALLATGSQADATITDAQQRGSVTRTRMKVTLGPGVEPGSRVRVAYDPMTRDAVLLDAP